LLRELWHFISTLLSARDDFVYGAEQGTVSESRTNRRDGYRHRDFEAGAGTVDVAVPSCGRGSYLLECLLKRRKGAERARTTVVATR
jgi:putative transposase